MIIYRADSRTLEQLTKAGGFKAWEKADDTEAAKGYLLEFLTGTKNLAEHIWGNDRRLISTGTDEDCGGQTGTKSGKDNDLRYAHIYKIDIPDFEQRDITNEIIGSTPYNFKPVFKPVLYMNAATLSDASIFGLVARKSAPELTMFTTIPCQIGSHRLITCHQAGVPKT